MDFLLNLPEDLVLTDIFSRFDYNSRVRVRAVCRRWRDLSPPPVADMPWLWSSNWNDSKHILRNFSTTPATDTAPSRPPDEIRQTGENICSRGPFLLSKVSLTDPDHSRHPGFLLYNPFTGDTFQLPRMTHNERPLSVACGAISGDPENCLVAVADVFDYHFYVTSPGKNHWIKGPKAKRLYDMLFRNGRLYCVDYKGKVVAFEVGDLEGDCPSSCTPHIIVPKFNLEQLVGNFETQYYLLESRGDLLVAVAYTARDKNDLILFTLHKIDEKEGKLLPVYDLGDQMLFVNSGSSRFWSGPSPNEFFTKNCIYFVNYARTLIRTFDDEDEDGDADEIMNENWGGEAVAEEADQNNQDEVGNVNYNEYQNYVSDENEGNIWKFFVRLGKFELKNEARGASFAVFHEDDLPPGTCCWITSRS